MSGHSNITYRGHTFLSSTAMGLSAIVITIIVSCTVVVLYGVHLASEKSERVITLAQSAVRGLPEFRQALPPALSDMLDDRRQPDYCDNLAITAKLVSQPDAHGTMKTTVEVVNNGKEVVSLLSLRVIVLDDQGLLLGESHEWAATPFAADTEWRGPIMPGSRRRFVSSRRHPLRLGPMDEAAVEVEITELRVWNGPDKDALLETEASPQTAVSASDTIESPDNG